VKVLMQGIITATAYFQIVGQYATAIAGGRFPKDTSFGAGLGWREAQPVVGRTKSPSMTLGADCL
jgi:hypothetical protein